MRRSVREALVGFSLLAAIGGGLGLWLWLKGVSLARTNWIIRANFEDAAGLAPRSPVLYRGVLVGRVKGLQVNERQVVAELEISDSDLRLSRPVLARVGTASLLGGDAVVSLLTTDAVIPSGAPGPRDRGCDNRRLVCERGEVAGIQAPNLDSVTGTMQKLLDQADSQRLVQRLAESTASFTRTAREAEKLSTQGQAFVGDAKVLTQSLTNMVERTDPILRNVTAASNDASQASQSLKRIARRLENPATAADLEATLANARQLTERWTSVGGDLRQLTDDPRFIEGLQRVSVGLGRFFDDLYPSGAPSGSPGGSDPAHRPATPAPRPRAIAPPAPPAAASTDRRRAVISDPRTLEDRMAPRSKAPAMPLPARAVPPAAAP
jgi:phospholipid/cholesterol/gamma-HCH transport system substrate-binding protein